jgi:hypothetical protein
MDNADFEATFDHWQAMPDDHEGIYRTTQGNPGDHYDPGGCALDSKLTMLAELFLVADADQRQMLRDTFADQGDLLWDLNLFARRTTLWMDGMMDDRWIMRGLAAIAIENASVDYRDTAVTLIILRFASDLAGLDFAALVNAIPELQSEALYDHIQNAVTYNGDNLRFIIESFAPPHLRDQLPPV